MAAPNIVGPHRFDDNDQTDHDQVGHDYRHAAADPGYRPDGSDSGDDSGDRARAERIAELADRLAAIESRDRDHRSRSEPGGSPGRGGPSGASPGLGTVPIGSSGSAGERTVEPGGHPEDALGDPEVVAKDICLRLLTAAARPRAALAVALRQRRIPDQVADAVLDRFVEVGLIDDRAYAEAFVAAKHRDRALGVTALRTELRRKGVDEVTVDAAVQTLDQDAERDRARALISRRVDAAMGNGVQAARRRLIGLLARRGYAADVARQVVDEALAEYGAEQDGDWLD
jgi:regulatory protein